MTNPDPYRSVRELCRELYDYDPPSITVRRWVNATNNAGIRLPAVKLGGEFRCRRSALESFLESMSQPLPRAGRSSKVQASRSELTKAKSLAAAERELSAEGIA